MRLDDIVITIILIFLVFLLVLLTGSLIYGLCTGTFEMGVCSNYDFDSTGWAINPANPASPTFRMIH